MPSQLVPFALLAVFLIHADAGAARADVFDHYINPVLDKTLESKNVKEIKQLTPNLIIDNDRVLPGIPSAFLIVRTNGNRLAKLLVQAAKQRDRRRQAPCRSFSIDRFVTYKEGEEQTRSRRGQEPVAVRRLPPEPRSGPGRARERWAATCASWSRATRCTPSRSARRSCTS